MIILSNEDSIFTIPISKDYNVDNKWCIIFQNNATKDTYAFPLEVNISNDTYLSFNINPNLIDNGEYNYFIFNTEELSIIDIDSNDLYNQYIRIIYNLISKGDYLVTKNENYLGNDIIINNIKIDFYNKGILKKISLDAINKISYNKNIKFDQYEG